MTLILRIEENGNVWHIPAVKIAENRARYYAERESTSYEQEQLLYKEELEYALSDEGEILDWFLSNMDYEDVQEFSVRVKTAPVPDHPTFDYDTESKIINI